MEDTFTKLEELLKQLSTGKGKERAILQAARKGLLEQITDESKKKQYYEKAVDLLESDKENERPAAVLAYKGKLYERAVALYDREILLRITQQRVWAEVQLPHEQKSGMEPKCYPYFMATFGLDSLIEILTEAITAAREGGLKQKVQEFYTISKNLYEAIPKVEENYEWNWKLARLANVAGMDGESNQLYNLAFDNAVASISYKYANPQMQSEIVVKIGREGKLWDRLIGFCLDEHKCHLNGELLAAKFSKEAGRELQAKGLYQKIITRCEMNGSFDSAAELCEEAGLEERAAFYRQLIDLLK